MDFSPQRYVSKTCQCDTKPWSRGCCRNCYNRSWSLHYPDRHAANLARRYGKREVLDYRKVYWMKNKDVLYLKRVQRMYGLTANQYKELYEFQRGKCALCLATEEKLGERLVVDHHHASGTVRGLLCRFCNACLGAHEKRKTGSFSSYLISYPTKEMKYIKETPLDQQVHPY